jgi:hypothetical protein
MLGAMSRADKVAFNLYLHPDLKRAVKVYCAKNDRDASDLTEELWQNFLRQQREPIRFPITGSRHRDSGAALSDRFPEDRKSRTADR